MCPTPCRGLPGYIGNYGPSKLAPAYNENMARAICLGGGTG
jgi:hypothetical protein